MWVHNFQLPLHFALRSTYLMHKSTLGAQLKTAYYCVHTPGEVHLEMCIKDLQERFAKVELQVSEPLVAFRESVFAQAEAPEVAVKPTKVATTMRTCMPAYTGVYSVRT